MPIKVPADFQIIAHRGASAYAPENTAAAFKLAYTMGSRDFELDTQLTSDGTVVLCHDLSLERFGFGSQVVEDTTWEALSRLDFGSWFSPFLYSGEKPFTLAELFDQYQDRVNYHVEIKGKAANLPRHVCELIYQNSLPERCVITSFSYNSLLAAKSCAPELRLGWLVDEINPRVLSQAEDAGLFQVCPQAARVTAAQVQAARKVTPQVRAWGVQGTRSEVLALIQRVVAAGCDGMTINWPDWVSH